MGPSDRNTWHSPAQGTSGTSELPARFGADMQSAPMSCPSELQTLQNNIPTMPQANLQDYPASSWLLLTWWTERGGHHLRRA